MRSLTNSSVRGTSQIAVSAAGFVKADSSGFLSTVANAGTTLTESTTPPSSPAAGDLWYNSDIGRTFIYYSNAWVEANPAVSGPTGATGSAGATGATGSSGVISVTAPITNSGTSTSAVLGVASNPTFSGTVTATSFSGDLVGGTNIATYTNMSTVPANTNTKIASLTGNPRGMYSICIVYDGGFATDGVTNYYWSSSYAGVTGIASAESSSSYYNASPQQQLIVSGTQHHRNQTAPTFWMYSDSANASYGNLSLYIFVPIATKFSNLQVIVKRLY